MRIFILKLQPLISSPVEYAKGEFLRFSSKLSAFSVVVVVNVAFTAL